MAKKNSTKTATKEALQASEPRVQTFSQWGGMYIKESPYGWTTDYEFERHGHVQNQTDLKPNFLMIQDNVISTSTKSLETRNETQLVSAAPDGLSFTGITCLAGNILYAAFSDGSIQHFNLDDAPCMDADDKWTSVTITDPDGHEIPFNWTSISYFADQLICFHEDSDGVGEIFSGTANSPFVVPSISATRYIPDPREDGQEPIVTDPYTTREPLGPNYSEDHLYIRPDTHLLVWKNSRDYYVTPVTIYGTSYPIPQTSPQQYRFYDKNGNRILPDDVPQGNVFLYDNGLILWKTYLPDAVNPDEGTFVFTEVTSDQSFITVDLTHRIQIAYTYSNKFGQTLTSNWATVYSNLNPLNWNSNTGGAQISQIVPGTTGVLDYEITGVDIYYTKDDNLDQIYLGHIEKNYDEDASENTLEPESTWKYVWYGAYSDLAEWTNVSLTVPTENTTKGVDAAYMNVHDGRCYFFGGSKKYRLYIGGRVGNELCIATGVGGAYVDIEPGSGMVINNTHKFKTYNGANIVTIMCGHPNTHQVRRFNLIQTNVTLTNELSSAGFMTEEVSNVVGSLSHHGSGVWAQGLFTLSRYGLALTTQQMENSNNLRAQLVSDAIQPIFTESLASALNNTQMIFVDDIVYFALSKGPQYLNCGLIGQIYSTDIQYYTRNNGAYTEDDPESESEYYNNIYTYYVQEAVLDDIIFAYDINSQAWYTFTYQPNLLDASIDDFGPDTPQDAGYPSAPSVGDIIHCTVNDTYWRYNGLWGNQYAVGVTEDDNYTWVASTVPHMINNVPCYSQDELSYHLTNVSTSILSLINFDSQSSPEGIGIVTTDRIEMIPTAGIIDNAPSYNSSGEIEVPNFVAHIETGELSTSSPPQQFHQLSQLEFRFDYFFGDIDIDVEGVDYYGRTFHVHKDVTYDEIVQDLAVYVRVDYIVNTYNIKIKGRAHFRLTHVMAKVYPESRKINLVYGFDDSNLYKKRHGGTQFTHHYIKDYNNLRRALEP